MRLHNAALVWPVTVLLCMAQVAQAQRPRRAHPAARPPVSSCPAPRVSQWEAIHDDQWPLIRHADGDAAWAHLEPAGLPSASATWCNPLAADSEAVRAGATLFLQHCATCHGAYGKGDGTAPSASENPRPYDFTRPEFAGMREPPGPAVLYAILTRGIDGTAMRAEAGALSGWERLAILAYVRELPGPNALAASKQWADTLRARRPNPKP